MANRPTVPDLKELFKQASDIAKQVPESMQEAAFNRALDMLTAAGASQTTEKKSSQPGRKANRALSAGNLPGVVDTLLASIDSTQHPGVTATAKVLDRALMILQIARTEHGVDGLTPTQIAKILTEKFRISTSAAATSMALGSATKLVNRTAEGKGYRYRIMGPGEDYLSHLSAGSDSAGESSVTAKRAKPRKKRPSSGKRNPARATSPKRERKADRSSSSRPGPKEFLEGLIANGFFTQRQEISSIISHVQDVHALTYKATDLSPTLVRLLRQGKLRRAKNQEGRYEYYS